MPFFEFLDDRGGADMQHTRSIPNATGVHGHINNIWWDITSPVMAA
jgi:hypothetical protein